MQGYIYGLCFGLGGAVSGRSDFYMEIWILEVTEQILGATRPGKESYQSVRAIGHFAYVDRAGCRRARIDPHTCRIELRCYIFQETNDLPS